MKTARCQTARTLLDFLVRGCRMARHAVVRRMDGELGGFLAAAEAHWGQPLSLEEIFSRLFLADAGDGHACSRSVGPAAAGGEGRLFLADRSGIHWVWAPGEREGLRAEAPADRGVSLPLAIAAKDGPVAVRPDGRNALTWVGTLLDGIGSLPRREALRLLRAGPVRGPARGSGRLLDVLAGGVWDRASSVALFSWTRKHGWTRELVVAGETGMPDGSVTLEASAAGAVLLAFGNHAVACRECPGFSETIRDAALQRTPCNAAGHTLAYRLAGHGWTPDNPLALLEMAGTGRPMAQELALMAIPGAVAPACLLDPRVRGVTSPGEPRNPVAILLDRLAVVDEPALWNRRVRLADCKLEQTALARMVHGLMLLGEFVAQQSGGDGPEPWTWPEWARKLRQNGHDEKVLFRRGYLTLARDPDLQERVEALVGKTRIIQRAGSRVDSPGRERFLQAVEVSGAAESLERLRAGRAMVPGEGPGEDGGQECWI